MTAPDRPGEIVGWIAARPDPGLRGALRQVAPLRGIMTRPDAESTLASCGGPGAALFAVCRVIQTTAVRR